MDTIPDPFALRNPSRPMQGRRSGFRVPFGLRDGRAWAPGEVARGKACGCVCPGCLAPLAAKAKESRRKRPHFAHLTDSDCQTGRETGIHLRAKQVIAEHLTLLVPGWNGDSLDMPNPPHARDDEGVLHRGRKIELPDHVVMLHDVEVERSFGGYQPDVYASDDVGELLIEIRVTHAVDETKARRVQEQGQRMIEIDLSHLEREVPHDPARFVQSVLFDQENRSWVSYPAAIEDWHASKLELDEQVAARNAEIARQREQMAMAAHARAQQSVWDAKDKQERKAYVRRLKRAKYADDLARLPALTSRERIDQCLREYRIAAEARVSELLDAVPQAVRSACLREHEDAWVFGVDPALWQLLAYDHFVARHSSGHRFNQRDVAAWVRYSFHHDPVLYRLFVAQYVGRAEARRAGYFQTRLAYWVFTEEENAAIPNFYAPINDFVDALCAARVIRHLPAPKGECEVLGSPPTGWLPVAAIDAGSTTAMR